MNTKQEQANILQSQEIYQQLTKTFFLLDDSDVRFFADFGLSTRQYWALQHLDEEQGRSMVDLSRLLFTDKSNVTGIVDRLERQGLVVRRSSTQDRRVNLITLTPQGRELRDRIKKRHDAHIQELFGIMGVQEQEALLKTLKVLSESLENYLAQ